jgi:hypothetical protein
MTIALARRQPDQQADTAGKHSVGEGFFMVRMRRMKAWMLLASGMALGLALGGAMTVGVLLGQRSSAAGMPGLAAGMPNLAELQLKAAATHGGETFAMATGSIDEDVEGLFTLDYLTGDLQCFVINPRNGGVGGWFQTNVSSIFSEKGKKPSYLLATGTINVAGGYGGGRPANSLCYVADANSGEIAAFTFPWVKAATSAGVAQASPMRLVKMWKTRQDVVRQ